MLHDGEGEDDRPPGAAPHPDDRLWRHPSEVAADRPRAAAVAPAGRSAAAAGPSRRGLLVVAVAAGTTGAVLAVVAIAVTGSLAPRVVERVVRTGSTSPTTEGRTPGAMARTATPTALAADAGRYVATVEVGGPHGRTGSAVVLRPDGVLVTSAAVVQGVTSVQLVRTDGTRTPAVVAGSDATTGLAVLRVQQGGLAVPQVQERLPTTGSSTVVVAGPDVQGRAGVWVTAVSRVERSAVAAGRRLRDLLEVDRPVAAAADGAALLGLDGALVGICVDAAGDDEMAGYAVPVGRARTVAADLVAYGRVRWAWLGVEGTELGTDDAARLDVRGGARITAVASGGPADRAGLHPDDVVVRVAGVAITGMDGLAAVLRDHRPGDEVVLDVRRDGRPVRVRTAST